MRRRPESESDVWGSKRRLGLHTNNSQSYYNPIYVGRMIQAGVISSPVYEAYLIHAPSLSLHYTRVPDHADYQAHVFTREGECHTGGKYGSESRPAEVLQ